MRAARAHHRRTRRDLRFQRRPMLCLKPQFFRHNVLRKLTNRGEEILSGKRKAKASAIVFNEAIQFFHHDKQGYRSRKITDKLLRHGPRHAQLQHGEAIAADFLYILITRAMGNDADGMIFPCFNPIAGRSLRICGKRLGALFHNWVAQLCIARHHNILLRIFLVGLRGKLLPFPGLHDALGMRHARTHFKENGGVELLGDRIGQLCKRKRLRAVRRL